MKLFGGVAPAEWLIVGLGNPGPRYEGTPHNVGFEVARALVERWGLGQPRKKFNALLADGRPMPGGPRIAVLLPQTYMNESGNAAGPARGALKVNLDHVVAVHDEIDLPFGEIRTKLGGGLAGHNGLRSLKAGFGSPEFVRVRVGVGRPDATDPEIVSAHVLGKWRESRDQVRELVDRAADAVEALVEGAEVP
ncbi:MAG: peptidyl-tRNA hydrolase, family [Solirubrobacteraceae bacterium]|nr:peptidyl-tRNA hydrolase, family [Solirubrobacteraceae bacterium]